MATTTNVKTLHASNTNSMTTYLSEFFEMELIAESVNLCDSYCKPQKVCAMQKM